MATKDTVSKTQELVEAARRRKEVEEAAAEVTAPSGTTARPSLTDEEREVMKEGAEERISTRPQYVNASLTGKLDPEAMGDVKGDGGDAKDYPEGDPDKALGVPVYEHGLAETRLGVDVFQTAQNARETRVSARTQAEIERGRKAASDAKISRETARNGRTVVTDVSDDPEGEEGRRKAEAEAKAKADADAKAEADKKTAAKK